jgi:hypothetical protein
MPALYLDSQHDDATRRGRLYAGDLYLYSPSAATKAFCDFARGMIENAFAPHDPELAQNELPVERYAETSTTRTRRSTSRRSSTRRAAIWSGPTSTYRGCARRARAAT